MDSSSRETIKSMTVGFAVLVVFWFVLGCQGCAKRGPTLVDSLRSSESGRVISVEQLSFKASDGLLSRNDLQNAKPIKIIGTTEQIEAFEEALRGATEGIRSANHPVFLGEVFLRVKTIDAIWYIFCDIHEIKNRRYCTFNAGTAGETNQNSMPTYQSDTLSVWLDNNKISPIN